uniref:Uncharacterized protein n=1 Tax=Physcomitrium patens TaxID=3218 RepID=A0A2K1KUE7_PHYPA|nr:hypothetical protein PHYPA_004397 [Physcomitrium patens]
MEETWRVIRRTIIRCIPMVTIASQDMKGGRILISYSSQSVNNNKSSALLSMECELVLHNLMFCKASYL